MSEYPTEPIPIVLTELGRQYLDQTRPWVRFMSILVFVGAGLMVLAGFAVMALSTLGGLGAHSNPAFGAIGGALLGVFYMLMAGLYIAPGIFLHRFAEAIKRLKATNEVGALDDAFKHQRSFWRFVGIMSIIGIVLGVAAIGIAIVAGVIGAMMSRA